MKIYFNWFWLIALGVIGYAVYKHFNHITSGPSPTGDMFTTINTNLAGVTD